MYGIKRSELVILPHGPAWKDDFEQERERSVGVLDNTTIVQIEHVGSTAIPTVWAKLILDIAIRCRRGNLEAVVKSLQALGYDYRGQYDDKAGHYYAVLDKGNTRLCQVHIYSGHYKDWHAKLHFRDVLSRNVELAQEYSDFKRALVKTAVNKSEYAENALGRYLHAESACLSRMNIRG